MEVGSVPSLHQSPSYESLMHIEREGAVKRVHSDSELSAPGKKKNSNWTCTLCRYENVDPTNRRCVLCGSQRKDTQRKTPAIMPSPNRKTSHKNPSLSPDAGALPLLSQTVEASSLPALPYTKSPDVPESNPPPATTTEEKKPPDPPGKKSPIKSRDSAVSLGDASEQSDAIAPLREQALSSFKGTANMVSLQLLDLTQQTSDDSFNLTSDSKRFYGSSEMTLPISNVGNGPHSESTLPMSNVKARDAGGASSKDVSLDDFYGMGSLPVGVTPIPSKNRGKKPQGLSSELQGTATVPLGMAAVQSMKRAPQDPPNVNPKPSGVPHMIGGDEGDIESAKLPQNKTARHGINESDRSTSFVSRKTKVIRFVFVFVVILIVVLSVALSVGTNDKGNTGPVVGVPSVSPAPTATLAPIPIEISPSASPVNNIVPEPTSAPLEGPTMVPEGPPSSGATTPSPTLKASPLPTLETSPPTQSPTLLETTQTPTSAQLETLQPTVTLTTAFVPVESLPGVAVGSRFGSSVALNSNGDLLAALGVDGTEPIQVFSLNGGTWSSLPTVPWDSTTSFSGESALSIASPEGSPIIAVASSISVRVLELVNGAWQAKGQANIAWVDSNSTVESSVAVSAVILSLDGNTLAAASLNEARSSIVVRVFAYNSASQLWERLGNPITRDRPADSTATFSSLSLAFSGNGRVVAFSDWSFTFPAGTAQAFEWTGGEWQQIGSDLTSTWGPGDVALSEDGQTIAVAADSPGTTRVYKFENDDWTQLGADISGGNSVSLNRGGLRLLLGRSLSSQVWVQDYREGVWLTSFEVDGQATTQFGSSVAISGDGNTLVVGSPLDDTGGNNAGRVFIYN